MKDFKIGGLFVYKNAFGFDMSHRSMGQVCTVREISGIDYSTKVYRFELYKEVSP